MCDLCGMYIRLQNYGTGKHLRWSPNSCPSPNGYNTCDFVICGWYLLGCFQGPLMIKSPQALQILAYIFCPINFPACYFFFLLLSLPCTSSLFFSVCSVKEQIVFSLLMHNHFWHTLKYVGIIRFFWCTLFLCKPCDKWFKVQQHYVLPSFLVQILTNGALTLFLLLLFACLPGLKSFPEEIQLFYNNSFSISGTLLDERKALPSRLAVILHTKHRILLNSLENSFQ